MDEPYYKQHWVDIDSERHSAYDQILAFHPALEPLLRPLELRPGLRRLPETTRIVFICPRRPQ